ncbi:hypothetical protein B0H10DRAFT_2074509 [Mycena sp. CBHHK59/15]|nr:hypothetical protein B0H10DRAFT_2074509 [Mycena sp. CBHHK59/15]
MSAFGALRRSAPYGLLHWSFNGSHALFVFIRLDSFLGFFFGSLLTVAICASERVLTYAYENRWGPSWIRRSSGTNALWRAGTYWVLATLRLAYMLIAMSMHAGYSPLEEVPLYMAASSEDVTSTRPCSKSKPDDILIHPTQSNLSRADAAAMTLGLSGSTERVHRQRYPHEAAAWEAGRGPDVARSLLGDKTRAANVGPRRAPFQIGGEVDSDSDA